MGKLSEAASSLSFRLFCIAGGPLPIKVVNGASVQFGNTFVVCVKNDNVYKQRLYHRLPQLGDGRQAGHRCEDEESLQV